MKITDGFKKVNITMKVWDKLNNEWKNAGEDIANEFFLVEPLPMNDEGTYLVRNVEDCLEQAEDWKNGIGDFSSEENENEDCTLFVDELPVTAEDVAFALRKSGEWYSGLCAKLCKMAGIETEWRHAGADDFEKVVFIAADELGGKVCD